MLRFSVFIMFSTSVMFCILMSAVSSIPPPPPPPPTCINGDVLSYCYNNPCLKNYCVQQEPGPDCKMEGYCLPGCLCKEGYLRAQNGTCVPHDECPTPIICGENEMYSRCINHACFKMNCSQSETSNRCKDHVFDGECVEGCMCKYTHLRADNGICVPSNKCPTTPLVCGENEELSKCSKDGCLQTNCSQLGRPPVCVHFYEVECTPECICKRDHLRTANGTCVPTKECPNNEVCSKPNEYYELCPPSCPRRDCRYDDNEVTCPPQPKVGDPSCSPSCRCKEGFYRNHNDDCIPYEDCSKFCYGNNEYFAAYPQTCEPQTCDSVSDTTNSQSTNTTCNSECRCHPGFVRNKHGECIAKENCGKCTGPNEYFGCKPSCDKVCATLDKANQTDCTTNLGLCDDKCYCDEGYARDANNICIPIADCPKEK